MIAAAAGFAAVIVAWVAGRELVDIWRDRPRAVRDVTGRWRAADPPRNGWGPKR